MMQSASVGSLPPPLPPANSLASPVDSNGNSNPIPLQHVADDSTTWSRFGVGACLPFFRLWNSSTVSGNSDSDSDAYEISLESIQVNFKNDYIGGGNQSSVFRGVWNGSAVALKKLNRATEVDIKMLKALEHPNVVRTFGVSTKDICPCIIMEYCEQGGLFDVLQRRKVTKSLFCKWSREIADGMVFLHSKKIIHRDLKSPNILIDKDDTAKICDFGSFYKFEKTFMPSVVMSFVGTTPYLSPEMLKSEPCNEKVDCWSYAVILWELLTQCRPYDGIASHAIMFGVGNDSLHLHVPKSAPSTAKLLFRICWSKKPRNRPSFQTITSHLTNLQAEVAELSEDSWAIRKQVWQKEIHEENNRLLHDNHQDEGSVRADELVKKRIHELRHAQDIREMYDKKKERVEDILTKLERLERSTHEKIRKLKQRELELDRWERSLRSRDPDRRSGRSLPPHSTCKVQRQTVVRTAARNGNRLEPEEVECRLAGVSAVLALQGQSDDADSEIEAMSSRSSSSDEEMRPQSRNPLPSCTSENSFARNPLRHSAGPTPKNSYRYSMPASASDRNLQELCPGCMYQFQRNSVARISGISADSGVCTSTLTLEETGQRLHSYDNGVVHGSPLYRNGEGRWSDGRIPNRRKPRRQGSRDSPASTASGTATAAAKKDKRLSSAGARLSGSGDVSRSGVPGAIRSMSMIESVELEVVKTPEEEGEDAEMRVSPVAPSSASPHGMRPSDSYTEAIGNGAPTNNRVAALRQDFAEAAEAVAAVMGESSSTMVSSLERSLELAVGLSDGLSDKESRFKVVKSHFKTHRRTASNPIPAPVVETSTESDNDAVYC